MNKRAFLLSFLLFLFLNGFSQNFKKSGITVYKNYEEYEEGSGVFYGGEYDFKSKKSTPQKDMVYFISSTEGKFKNLTFDLQDYWGFKHNDLLFRVVKSVALPVLNEGNIIYYEQRGGKYNCKVSNSLNSPIVDIYKLKRKAKKAIKEMVEENPNLKPFFDCYAQEKNDYDEIRKCVEKFNEKSIFKYDRVIYYYDTTF